jgi:hypothetical protein
MSTFEFPLKISPNHRYLVDQKDQPFLIHGDTAWSILTSITEEEAENYLANRAAKGFNAIIVNLIEHKFNGPLTRTRLHPFTDPRDLGTPNEAYFEYADRILRRAGEYGMVVFLAPMYLGYRHPADDDGWFQEARLSGMNGCYRYGQFLGKRYAGFKNIIWMIGGDRNPDGVQDEVSSLVVGIKQGDPDALFTAHPHPESITPEQYGSGGWLDINTTYTYHIVHSELLFDYNYKPTRPSVMIESSYEGEHNCPPVQIRRQAYWSPLCGACGQFLGNNPIWLFNPGWKEAMDLPGSRDMVHLKAFFTSRPWWNLVPDQKHQVLTGGVGEYRGLDYTAAALTADGNTLMAYTPSSRTLTVDLAKLNGSRVTAWWFDPRTGEACSAGEYATTGAQDFTPPAAGDWALVIDNAALNYSAPGK